MKPLRLQILEENFSRIQPAWFGGATLGDGIVQVPVCSGKCCRCPWIKVFRAVDICSFECNVQPFVSRNECIFLAAKDLTRRCLCAGNNRQLNGLREVAKVQKLTTEEGLCSLGNHGIGQVLTVGSVEMLQARFEKVVETVLIDPWTGDK